MRSDLTSDDLNALQPPYTKDYKVRILCMNSIQGLHLKLFCVQGFHTLTSVDL